MDIKYYLLGVGGAFAVLILFRMQRYIKIISYRAYLLWSRVSYLYFLPRFSHIGPWKLSTILLQAFFVFINLYIAFFSGLFRFISANQANLRTANLLLINLIPVMAGPSLSFLASLLGLPLKTFRNIHYSLSSMSLLLVVCHISTAIGSRKPFSLTVRHNQWALSATIWLFLTALAPLISRPYELSARIHQALALFLPFLIWGHLKVTPNSYFYLFLLSYPVALLPQLCLLVYRNSGVLSQPTQKTVEETGNQQKLTEHNSFIKSTATIVNLGDIIQKRLDLEYNEKRLQMPIALNHDLIEIRLKTTRPLQVKAGQYIGLWIPGVSKFSFVMVHPFTVASWSPEKTNSFRILVEPRSGWTKKLLQHSRLYSPDTSRYALFTGPYGVSIHLQEFGVVLLVATGLGIIAQLPYLKQLIHDYNARRGRTRRIHLIWKIKTLDIAFLFEDMLNEILNEDILDDGRILEISIYEESGRVNPRGENPKDINHREENLVFGKRARIYTGSLDLKRIFDTEHNGTKIRRVQYDGDEKERMLVLVSGIPEVRDKLRQLARGFIYNRVKMIELDYQPGS